MAMTTSVCWMRSPVKPMRWAVNMIAALLNNAVAYGAVAPALAERAKSLANYLAEAVESVVHNKRSGQSLQELAAQGICWAAGQAPRQPVGTSHGQQCPQRQSHDRDDR